MLNFGHTCMRGGQVSCVIGRTLRAVNLGPYPADLSDWMRQFKVKLVDVNRVSKGSPTGRISQFSALTVAGNKNVSTLLSALAIILVMRFLGKEDKVDQSNLNFKGTHLVILDVFSSNNYKQQQ